ncbi:hypothetical protein ACFL4U_01495 [Candidatus Neomarinimicrobiota bacterium]
MSSGPNIEQYLSDPSLLIDLCREVIEEMGSTADGADTQTMEAQLREISKAVTKLEKIGVVVPDTLRGEKTRLAAVLGEKHVYLESLKYIATEMRALANELESRLDHTRGKPGGKKIRRKRSNLPCTDRVVYREYIIQILKDHGGSVRGRVVLEAIDQIHHDKFLEGDLEIRQDGHTIAWRNNVCWERNDMRKEGIIRSDSPRGVWELSEEYK